MSEEKTEEKAADASEPEVEEPPQERIASALNGIRNALVFIGLLLFMRQCQGVVPGESKESKALDGISYELRIIAGKLGNVDGGYRADLQGLNRTLSNLNDTIQSKSCSR